MRVYIIEDDPLKLRQISSFVTEMFPLIKVSSFHSFHSGLRAIQHEAPDLLLLDMTLPTFDRAPGVRQGRVRHLGGYDLLRKIDLRGISLKTIIITQIEKFGELEEEVSFQQVDEKCHREFSHLMLASIYFQQSRTDWKGKLEGLIADLAS